MKAHTAILATLLAMAIPAAAQGPEGPAGAIPSVEDAPIAFLYDMSSGQILFERDADRRFMPASITKVMTTFLAFEWMDEGRIDPRQVYTIRPETWRKWSGVGSTMFLPHDARVTVDDLVHGITTVSANDGSVVLAEGAGGSVAEWTAAMNAKAAEIGMRNSHFENPNGWMDEGRTFTTARDLARLGQTMILRHPSKYRHFVGQQEFEYNGIRQSNHDPISGRVPGADGIKTGFTNQAGYGFLGSASRNGRRLVMVVAASPRGRARNDAAREFIEWGFEAFDSRLLFPADRPVATARVQGGDVRKLDLVSKSPIRASVARNAGGEIQTVLHYNGPLRAPIAKGEEVAQLEIRIDGMDSYRVPLLAAEEVEEADPLQRAINGFVGWLT